MKLAPVLSFEQLKSKFNKDDNYKKLVLLAAKGSFHLHENASYEDALTRIKDNIDETNDHDGVIEEVNAYIGDIDCDIEDI